jgi:hypothetical protein
MLKCWAFISIVLIATPASANEPSPWFGSAASAPEQISLVQATVTTASLTKPVECPIEGCKTAKNLGKQPE